MQFTDSSSARGVTERRFEIEVSGRSVPGLLWTPSDASGARPVVMLGHGGSGTKSEGYIVAMARRLVRHWDFAAVAIDGPAHGDRKPEGADELRAQDPAGWRRRFFGGSTTDDMNEDWQATLDAAQELGEIGAGPAGYWGISMGTSFGLPLVAAEPRIKAAVLGLNGSMSPRLMADAPKVTCPVLFIQQLEDELMPRDKVVELFDALGTPDKRLHANPGAHSAVPPEEFQQTERFLGERLRDAAP